jgi:glycosyltransferase involved in cell wall biosynthesis
MHLLERSKIAIIIPAYNESNTIGVVVKKLNKLGKVIVIDDASKDKTSLIAKKNGALVVRNKLNKGYDNSINIGYEEIKKRNFKIFITCDGDGQFYFNDVRKMIKLFSPKYRVLIGSRNKIIRLSEKIFSLYTKKKFGIIDPLCGLKCYNLEFCKNKKNFDRYNSIGTDLMLQLVKKKKHFKNLNLRIKKRKDTSRFGNSLISNFKILRSLLFYIFLYEKKN